MAPNGKIERTERLGLNEALSFVRGVRAEILDRTDGLRDVVGASALGERLSVEVAAIDEAVDELWEAAEGEAEDLLRAEEGWSS